MTTTFDPAKIRARLLAMKEELLQASLAHEADRRPVELDQQSVGRLSRMDAMQMQAMASAMDRQRQVQVARIEAALARIDNDSYGDCPVCGEPIEAKRLALDPAIPACLACARRQ
jgi:DnaK suppressor protein